MEAHENPASPSAMWPERMARACTMGLVVLVLIGAWVPGSTKQTLLSPFPLYLHADKLGHALGFAGLGFAFVRSRFARVQTWHILAFALALGALTEFFQRFIPGRTGKLSDVLVDLAGACAGVCFAVMRRTDR